MTHSRLDETTAQELNYDELVEEIVTAQTKNIINILALSNYIVHQGDAYAGDKNEPFRLMQNVIKRSLSSYRDRQNN